MPTPAVALLLPTGSWPMISSLSRVELVSAAYARLGRRRAVRVSGRIASAEAHGDEDPRHQPNRP